MATGMTGLPLESPLSSYQTEIANNTTTSGPAIPSINYYQRVMSGFFETMGIPILQGRGFQSTDAVSAGMVAVVNETLTNTERSGLASGYVHRSGIDNTLCADAISAEHRAPLPEVGRTRRLHPGRHEHSVRCAATTSP